jgi:hypothetical protein
MSSAVVGVPSRTPFAETTTRPADLSALRGERRIEGILTSVSHKLIRRYVDFGEIDFQ